MRNDKYKLCIKAIELTWKTLAPDFEKCYVWLDFGCINQDGDPAGYYYFIYYTLKNIFLNIYIF